MATTLRRFGDAYASMVVAAYEPLILRWISGMALKTVASNLALRAPKARLVGFQEGTPPALGLAQTFRERLPMELRGDFGPSGPARPAVDREGSPVDASFTRRVPLDGYPRATAVGGAVFPFGTTQGVVRGPNNERSGPPADVHNVSAVVANTLGRVPPDFDLGPVRQEVYTNLVSAAASWIARPQGSLASALQSATSAGTVRLPHLVSEGLIEEALSPIGIAHFYRQLYFHLEEGVGPIEEAFTIAPLETFEVVYETIRKQVHEEILEQGLESVSESAVEEKNLDEISDKVSSMVQQDFSAALSANTSGGIGVWSTSVTASADFGVSSQTNREFATKRLRETTRRASERITKSFSIKTRDLQEVTATSRTRRVIRNDSAQPVSYGLRRLLRRVMVKVQDMGPRLVWQLYISNAGEKLLRGKFLHLLQTKPVVTGDPPGTPPTPAPGSDTGTQQCTIYYESVDDLPLLKLPHFDVVILPGRDREVEGLIVTGVSDIESGGKDDQASSVYSEPVSTYDKALHKWLFKFRCNPGDGKVVSVSYTYNYVPSASAIKEWEDKRADALAQATQELLIQQFEQQKATVTERSKIKARPANDLRREERYEVMGRLVGHLFDRGDDPSAPTPLEIEYFSRYLDIEGMFVYTHPAWWRPKNVVRLPGLPLPTYDITAESEPAPFGSSLGWVIQLDGDGRRNEFINSPWVRVCLPLRPGREREAIRWLAEQLEGQIGFDIDNGPLSEMVLAIEGRRGQEQQLGMRGADYVTVSSTPGAPADPLSPEGVFPVVDEFAVTVPTEGFVYDELAVMTEA